MKAKTPSSTIRLQLEALEPRQAPSASPWLVENFDSTSLGSLPWGWSQWSSSGYQAFRVASGPAVSGSHDLAASAPISNLTSRAWVNTLAPADVQVSADVYLNSLSPSQVLLRGTALNTATPAYYALSVTRGLQLQLVRLINGNPAILAQMQSAHSNYVSGTWVRLTLASQGSTLRGQVYRLDTGQYLGSTGQWQAAPAWALTRIDTAITGVGQVGLARPAGTTGTISFDDFSVVWRQNGPALPVIPRHYPHIRIAELAYSGNPMGAFEDQLLRNSVDLVVPDNNYLSHIAAIASKTPRLAYLNVSNLYLNLLTSWLDYAESHGFPREQAFYHVPQASPFAGDSPSSQPVNWFWAVFQGASTWTDWTYQAHGPYSGGVPFGGKGQSLAIGYPDRFREINLSLSSRAANGWSAVWEYPASVDSFGRPTVWAALSTLSNTTGGLTRSGQILFDPPANWQRASINGSARLYFVRVRTIAGGTIPLARSILGRDYVGANGTTRGVIPAFDSAADRDHDGYLNDAEYARRAPGMNARFLYESRMFYGNYGQMRFVTNPSDQGYRKWAVDYAGQYLRSLPLATGLFMDNSGGSPPFNPGATIEPVTNYAADYGTLLGAIGRAIAPRWILANTAGGGTAADTVVAQTPAYYEEFAIRPLANNYQQFLDLADTLARRAASSPAPYAVLDSLPTGGAPTDPRTQLATLAYYYLLANPANTFLDFFGGYEPATSWTRHWVPAAAFNIGQPLGPWSLFASGRDPDNWALTYQVYQRRFTNALVLYKPLSYGGSVTGTTSDNTATTFSLARAYHPLNADGTLGPAVTRITLRNGEGAILI